MPNSSQGVSSSWIPKLDFSWDSVDVPLYEVSMDDHKEVN